ncbi:hypothetical protein BC833DRAFT_317198 [Globomyces pollinis-pini]|nr:hypothetical protein BC833DRAFT_317198 [Globomyces pollinis-pini]
MRGDNMREVPSSVVHQLLRFYATFVAAGSPIEVPFIPPIVREMVATGLLDLTCDRTVSITVFDKIAEIAIESLFCRCFQKYLMIKGANIPSLKEVLQAHKDWEIVNMQDQFAKSTISDSSPRQSTEIGREKEKQKSKNSSSMNLWDKMKGMGKKDKIKLKHTRDCMVEVLQNPKYYAMFSQFVKETHCEENLVCFESFLKLESRSRQRPDNMIPLSLERFLDTNVEDEDKDTPIPVVLAPLYMFFDQMFVKPESPFEVNVTHTLRKSIDVQLRNIKNSMIPISIFDPVIDHVLELLYVNSFLLFIKSRADE